MRIEQINRFTHSHTATMLLTIVAVCGIIAAFLINPGLKIPLGPNSLGVIPAHRWIENEMAIIGANLALSLGTGFILLLLNREFKLMRDKSKALAGLFMFMQMAMPQAMFTFTGGTLLALVVVACTFVMFSIYNNPDSPRTVFTIFMLLGAGSITFYGYIFFVPLFLIGCVQVRVLTPRTFTAAILGLITPIWIAGGFGLLDTSYLTWPDIDTILTIAVEPEPHLSIIVTAGLTALICVLFGVGCAIRSYSYNSQSRAYNGFIYIMMLSIIVLSCVDFNSAYIYLSLLNCCAAYQIVHFFITNHNPHSVIGIIMILIAYMGLYFWNIQ